MLFRSFVFAIVLMGSLAAGCADFKRVPIDRNSYMLQVPAPAQSDNKINASILLTNSSIVPQFSNSFFVYRTSALIYDTDYYNRFFIEPALQVTQIVSGWLQTNFTQVLNAQSVQMPDYIIQCHINTLYANYADRQQPTANIGITVKLLKRTDISGRLIYQQTYSESVPIQEKSSAGLVNAWDAGLTSILQNMMPALRQAIKS